MASDTTASKLIVTASRFAVTSANLSIRLRVRGRFVDGSHPHVVVPRELDPGGESGSRAEPAAALATPVYPVG